MNSSNSAQPNGLKIGKANKIANRLAAMTIVLMVIGVGSIYLAGTAYEIVGPQRIAGNASGAVLLSAYDTLFLIAPDGKFRKLAVGDIGLHGPVNSIVTFGDDWVLSDESSGLLYRCTAALAGCKNFFGGNPDRVFNRAHGVVFKDGLVIVADSERHRLRVLDADGREAVTTRTAPVELCYPNELIAVDKFFYVTDTENFRIARVDPNDGFRSETFIQTSGGDPFKTANCTDVSSKVAGRGDAYANLVLDTAVSVGRRSRPPARPNRVLPAAVLHSRQGDWWIIQMMGKMTSGDVILYSSTGAPIRRVDLPKNSDPTYFYETSNGVLIVDPTLSRVFDAALDGSLRGEWGSDELKTEFRNILKTRERWAMLKPIGWVFVVLSAALGLIVVALEIVRKNRDRYAGA